MKRRIMKMMGNLTAALVMVLTVMAFALPVHAAGGSIKLTYDPGIAELGTTTFTVYKVGAFGSGEHSGELYLDPAFNASGVNVNIAVPAADATDEEKEAWRSEWLGAARTLADHAETHADDVAGTLIGTADVEPGPTPATIATVTTNGLYLLVGSEQQVGDKIWSPVPSLVLVLNEDATFTYDADSVKIKMVYRPVVHKHTIIKKWVGGETVRPESIDVDIFYGSQKIDTVTLSGEGEDEWTYTWYSSEDVTDNGVKGTYSSLPENAGAGAAGVDTAELNEGNHWYKTFNADSAASWKVAEVFDPHNTLLFKFFSYEVDNTSYFIGEQVESANEEIVTITNTFGTDRIKITKKLTNFAKIKGMTNAVIGYQVDGYTTVVKDDGSEVEEIVYTNRVGMVFDRDGTQSIVIYGVPQHLTKVVVREIYVGDYEPDESTPSVVTITDPRIITETAADGTTTTFKQYEAYFWNNFKDIPHLSGGISNKYSKDANDVYRYEGSETFEKDPEN